MELYELYVLGAWVLFATVALTAEALRAVTDPAWRPGWQAAALYLVIFVGIPTLLVLLW